MSSGYSGPPASPVSAGLAGRCPRCGQGRLFQGYIKVRPRCEACDLDFAFVDSGDGPAVFIMMLVGFVVVGGALAVEILFKPPMWVHLMLWIPLTLGLALGMLRPLKGLMIAQQYARGAREGRLSS